jgi:methylenetetrahydrofolate reductase (NADPH)
MKELLVALNHAGMLTINSQPPVNGVPSEDKTFGWGGPNGFIYQKARAGAAPVCPSYTWC